jgi:hypothetical protein
MSITFPTSSPVSQLEPSNPLATKPSGEEMDTEKAREYLSSILNKNLRVYTSDGRLFWGALKCTDPVCFNTLYLTETLSCQPLTWS